MLRALPNAMSDRRLSETLASWMARVGRVPEPIALELVRDLARALAVAHGTGFVHRDLRPQFIYLTFRRDGRPRLFGIRRDGAAPPWPSPYAAPELDRPGAVDGRADLYSLGCVLHEMLCGRPPLDAPLRLDISHATAAVIARLIAPSPLDRFTSAGDLLDTLSAEPQRNAGG
jgi:serine/threonine protein kinase